jgi:transposase
MRHAQVINQIRGLLLERGITPRRGRFDLDVALPGIVKDATAPRRRIRRSQRQDRNC